MKFVPITTYDNYIPAHIAMGCLKEEGIECWLKDEYTVTIDPILTNAVGGIKLMVEISQAEKAAGILKGLELKYKDSIRCTKCGSHNIELVNTPRRTENWISAILGFLSFNYAMPYKKVHHCFDCGNEFDASDQW